VANWVAPASITISPSCLSRSPQPERTHTYIIAGWTMVVLSTNVCRAGGEHSTRSFLNLPHPSLSVCVGWMRNEGRMWQIGCAFPPGQQDRTSAPQAMQQPPPHVEVGAVFLSYPRPMPPTARPTGCLSFLEPHNGCERSLCCSNGKLSQPHAHQHDVWQAMLTVHTRQDAVHTHTEDCRLKPARLIIDWQQCVQACCTHVVLPPPTQLQPPTKLQRSTQPVKQPTSKQPTSHVRRL
jgi:hypothetical protein